MYPVPKLLVFTKHFAMCCTKYCLYYEQIIHHALCILIEFTWRTVENDCIVTVSLFVRGTLCCKPGACWPPAAWSAAWSADCWHCPAGTAPPSCPPPFLPPWRVSYLMFKQGTPYHRPAYCACIGKNTTARRLHSHCLYNVHIYCRSAEWFILVYLTMVNISKNMTHYYSSF